jgi:superfamily II DNA/RNA helicase
MTALEELLVDDMSMVGSQRKVIIFSEWLDSHVLIGQLLDDLKIGYTKLTGSIAADKRGALIDEFANNDSCQVFLSTEAGGAGLNLQMADTVINFEIPWNPAKKNQRIGRIDRIGQSHEHLTVINLICQDSIELQIAGGLVLKQNLFDGVLNAASELDEVDFSQKGRAQFIKQLEDFVSGASQPEADIDMDKLRNKVEKVEQSVELESESNLTIEPEEKSNTPSNNSPDSDFEKMEEVLQNGMQFLSGIYEMSTGKSLGGKEGSKIEIDKETGEVVMRFKL